nr:hypothetical protein [Salmonella enterica]
MRHEGELAFIFDIQRPDVLWRLHQVHPPFRVAVLAHGAFHFRVPGVADENRFLTATAGARHFHMDFRHQRAGGVKNGKIAAFRLVTHRLGNPMSGENQNGAIRHFANLLYKDRPALAQAVHYIAVMHDFVPNVNWRAVNSERIFNNADSAVYPGAKTAWVGQQDLHVYASSAGSISSTSISK